ncbi:GntR family transcriptional regulator [Nocardia neocaledoniensis NBRC 108232]|uniref:GntR family transcriptional regulator n=1 Tax=Nocardia neocaledoniensis TaxID=236511 RepID=A0A317N1N4_9NOCA|nr:GntR family transcriptional regulator [Nocardia neocaledoniensis]PWV67552.1 GntR family transcriptional regulator [Nocardia neocaledoniensis]GEM31250.1 GntR family transcriptional regulator [Nocardia neocaledoniensis NBRC 108232]
MTSAPSSPFAVGDGTGQRDLGGERRQLPEEVAGHVRERIISGQVRPGEFVRAEAVAETLGVSNTPVRAALLMLSADGFLELVPRRGYRVVGFTREDVRDMFWLRATVSGELAGRAATRISAERLDHLDDVVEAHVRAARENIDVERILDLGHEFHRVVNLAAESPRLAIALGAMVKQLPNRFYFDIEGHGDDSVRDHPAILDALRRRRADSATSLMREHIMAGADDLVSQLEKVGMWDEEPG